MPERTFQVSARVFFTKCDSGYLLTDPGRPPFDGKIDVGLACVDSDFGSYCRALPRLT
jgi:hypothetical protein